MTPDEKAREIAAAIVRDYFETVHADDFEPLADIIATALLAARREGIEEAAKVADARNLSIMSMTTADITALEIAAAIRALP